jgi:hypothetical protein
MSDSRWLTIPFKGYDEEVRKKIGRVVELL